MHIANANALPFQNAVIKSSESAPLFRTIKASPGHLNQRHATWIKPQESQEETPATAVN